MFFPEAIDLSESEKYVLAIRLQADKFSFAIYLPGQNNAYVYKETTFRADASYLEQVQRTIFDLNFLTQPFFRTWVEIASPVYTLVPKLFFDVKEKERYLRKTFSGDCGQILHEFVGSEEENVLVYDMEKELYEFLSRNLFSPVFVHHTSSLIDLFNLNSGKPELFSRMYVYLTGDQADIFVTRDGAIQTMQSFVEESDPNLLYYAMNIWQAFGMDQLKDRLFVSGDASRFNNLIPMFSKYIQYVEQKGAPSEAFLLGNYAMQTPIDLLALLL